MLVVRGQSGSSLYSVSTIRFSSRDIPQWIPHDKERNVDFICVSEDIVRFQLDSLPSGYDDFSTVKCFLDIRSLLL